MSKEYTQHWTLDFLVNSNVSKVSLQKIFNQFLKEKSMNKNSLHFSIVEYKILLKTKNNLFSIF